MQIDFPYHFDPRDRTAETDEAEHIRDLIEQLLFTQPGERVNRPEFGVGINQLVFSPLSSEAIAAAELMIRGALQQYLGQRIEVIDVETSSADATLHITIVHRILRSGTQHRVELTTGAGP
ncbi:GPW/gp25 family protein [Salipiger bermudensis]|uniref:GPW/gp25 family protein n=1 Tax=Salipiger bermudensis TaxID=344736 RepID=UPI001C99EC9E|nr:GPW/gp25 family protein [Salipiger bermudensis]MBY6005573.1 GPW/gp25 family protein [Salipiger bermudensis]